MKKGLSRQLIFEESEKLLIKKGFEKLSLREISASLGVKPPSLYNHIDGIGEIYGYLSVTAADKLKERLLFATMDKAPDEAFIEGGIAYRRFAEENRELYKVLISSRSAKDAKTRLLCKESFAPIRAVIDTYGGNHEQTLNFIRAFRSFMHGFVEITYNGFMQKGTIGRDATYKTVLEEFLKILKGFKGNA